VPRFRAGFWREAFPFLRPVQPFPPPLTHTVGRQLTKIGENMAEVIKTQPKCYFITPEHASSFLGKYLYLYSGQGKLQLSGESLAFESKSLSLEIPIQAIRRISVEMFSRWAKPFGLAYISLQYLHHEKERTIFLVPVESAYMPSWKTCKVVEDWIAAFGRIDELSNRIKLPLPQVKLPSFMQLALFFLLLFAFNMIVFFYDP
jgi:hypothetical protein